VAKALVKLFSESELTTSLWQSFGLQFVLNTAARLLVGAKKHDHIKHVLLNRLHWLPVPQRV